MRRMQVQKLSTRLATSSAMLAATLILCGALTGCIGIGYSSRGGWFLWPGGFGLVVIILVFLLLSRRR